ncbi:MAG TPA: dihydroorotate dehydrogenase electron transfer subunit [Thermoplasmata archaeon]|nr:dihydroorotate dehydrogenase electron transfer subunit [Thermoplasmata archaeon]
MRTACRVEEKVQETPSTVTLRFRYPSAAVPGQFVMIWLPGDDELPMSLSYLDGELKGVTIKAMGDTSRRVQAIQAGSLVGIRGPYGGGFDLTPQRILIVGGGSGAAVLAPAAEAARRSGAGVTVALGATTRSELLFEERFRAMGAHVHVATDDGSLGTRGYVTDLARTLLGSHEFDVVWTCGPEVMMRKVVDAAAARRTPVVMALERHMKCALGLCDACAIGPYHVCLDGPVFPAEKIVGLPEFDRFQRDASGRRIARH